ncbi:MAG: hypothetical protein AAB438_02170 [Patescibacteria group bacterium]
MSLIEKLRILFHTEKWWGKMLFSVLLYVSFWLVFFGFFLLFPIDVLRNISEKAGKFISIYTLALVPIISFFLPVFIRKVFPIRRIIIYPIHIVMIPIFIVLFFICLYFVFLNSEYVLTLPSF